MDPSPLVLRITACSIPSATRNQTPLPATPTSVAEALGEGRGEGREAAGGDGRCGFFASSFFFVAAFVGLAFLGPVFLAGDGFFVALVAALADILVGGFFALNVARA